MYHQMLKQNALINSYNVNIHTQVSNDLTLYFHSELLRKDPHKLDLIYFKANPRITLLGNTNNTIVVILDDISYTVVIEHCNNIKTDNDLANEITRSLNNIPYHDTEIEFTCFSMNYENIITNLQIEQEEYTSTFTILCNKNCTISFHHKDTIGPLIGFGYEDRILTETLGITGVHVPSIFQYNYITSLNSSGHKLFDIINLHSIVNNNLSNINKKNINSLLNFYNSNIIINHHCHDSKYKCNKFCHKHNNHNCNIKCHHHFLHICSYLCHHHNSNNHNHNNSSDSCSTYSILTNHSIESTISDQFPHTFTKQNLIKIILNPNDNEKCGCEDQHDPYYTNYEDKNCKMILYDSNNQMIYHRIFEKYDTAISLNNYEDNACYYDNIDSLLKLLEKELNKYTLCFIPPANFKVTYDYTKKRTTIVNTTGAEFGIGFNLLIDANIESTGSLHKVLGFDQKKYLGVTSITSIYDPIIFEHTFGEDYILICSDNLLYPDNHDVNVTPVGNFETAFKNDILYAVPLSCSTSFYPHDDNDFSVELFKTKFMNTHNNPGKIDINIFIRLKSGRHIQFVTPYSMMLNIEYE